MSTLYPYKNFMENEEIYLETQRVWSELIEHIANVNGLKVQPYMNLNRQRSPIRDGNPIAALKTEKKRKGVRIILVDPNEEGGDFSAWFNNFGEEGSDNFVKELVLDLKLSHATLGISAILIERWLTERLNEASLEEWLSPWRAEEE